MTALTSMMEQPAIRAFGWTLVHFIWQAAVIAGLVAILLPGLRRASSHSRYLTLCGALVAMAISPVVTWCWIVATPPALPLSAPISTASSRSSGTFVPTFNADPLPPSMASDPLVTPGVTFITPETSTTSDVSVAPAMAWQSRLRQIVEVNLTWLVGIWFVGVCALSIRLLAGWRVVQQLRHRSITPVATVWQERLKELAQRMRISRSIKLVESALVDVPTVIGWLRPMILLPTSFLTGLAPDQVESILVHELAHIRRHDFVVNLMQTTIEVLLFYHPAVWWLSGRIRQEREHCCDDIAVAVCGNTFVYARALATMEELRLSSSPRSLSDLALAGNGGSLLQRIRRLTVGRQDVSQSNWWGASLFALATVAGLGLAAYGVSQAMAQLPPKSTPSQPVVTDRIQKSIATSDTLVAQADPTKPSNQQAVEWGAESHGVRCRIVPVPSQSDDEAPGMSQIAKTFARSDDMTFAVELKNVSDKPITLMGVRYGDSYPTAVGKLNTSFFGPHLFDCEFSDANGKPVPRVSRVYDRDMLALSGASTHTLAPGQSLVELLRPDRFGYPMNHRRTSGQYRLKVKYHGPSEATVAEIKKHWPDKPHVRAWTHEAISNEVAFAVTPDSQAAVAAKLVWGPVRDGLQAAIELQRPRPTNGAVGSVGSPTEAPGVPTKAAVNVVFHVKNVGDKPITFSSETGRQGDTIKVQDEAGKDVPVSTPWFSGWPIMVRWVLQPGEIAELHVLAPGLHMIEKPGKYSVQYTIRFNSMQSKDDAGNITFPLKEDWQSELVTGATDFYVRARTPEDDAREMPPTFVSHLEFVGPDGQPVESGRITWDGEISRKDYIKRPFGRGPIEIPQCTAAPASVTVRAPGYEEAVFLDVKLKPNETKRFELVPVPPARLKLVYPDGKPVVGANIRFFNKTSALASAGPIPMDGFDGLLWTTTGDDGTALIESMQRVDPYYKKLGDALYFFCIQAPTAMDGKPTPPPRVIGPVKAGQDLGVVTIGPPLEVHGEIRGTAEELKRFAAEWDQPFAMRTENPDATWDYAVSKPLETKQDGDKLTFHLTGLTPGRLRVIANFGPTPHSVSHTYSRRDPKEGDTVVDIELKESLNKLVITSKGRLDDGGISGTSFMGVRDEGMKVAFVIDASGSMASHNAMHVAKGALMSSLQAFDERQQFTIIFYDDKPHLIKLQDEAMPTMAKATHLNKTLARQKISGIQPGFGTDHLPPLEMAMRTNPDVIFFLTDALEPPLWPKDLERIRTLNDGRVRIHSIEFGQGPEPGVGANPGNFLRKLADQNGGSYHYHDVTRFTSKGRPDADAP
jgi:beta-lactamase regulating signal transducer with metallopeptidase domain